MNFKIGIVLLLLLKAVPSFALKTDTIRLFYPIDKYALSPENKNTVNGVIDSLMDTDTLTIVGYADYLGHEKHNVALSINRANTVKLYFESYAKTVKIVTFGQGGIPSRAPHTPLGEPHNRRVDLIFKKSYPPFKTAVKPPMYVKPAPPKPPTFTDKMRSIPTLEPGKSVSLEELTFLPGRHFLNPEAQLYADTLLTVLKNNLNITFEIQGHICCDFDNHEGWDYDDQRYSLSTSRARYIYDFLKKNGINPGRMRYRGMGSGKPKVYPELTSHDQYINRRVEIMVTGK